MDRSSLLKLLGFGLVALLFFQFVWPSITGDGEPSEIQPLQPSSYTAPEERAEESRCKLQGERFQVELSSRGASIRSATMLDKRYETSVEEPGTPTDLATTKVESYMPLRTNLRVFPGGEDVAQQVPFDDLDWKLTSQSEDQCVFVYEDDGVRVEKIVARTPRPFELEVSVTVENKSDEERVHRFTVEQTSWRLQEETEGSLGRVSPWFTRVNLSTDQGTERYEPGDFDADEFGGPQFTDEAWLRAPGAGHLAAVESTYYGSAVIHADAPMTPYAEAVIQEHWNSARFPNKDDDPRYGHVYRARLNYGEKALPAGESVTYKTIAFFGPKEREVLAAVGGSEGSDRYEASNLIDLGWFGSIGKVLIGYLYWLYGIVGSWGWSICLMTMTVKIVLFPLSIAQIRSSFAMRQLKPQLDEINKKYKDDATQKALAMQELYRKEGLGKAQLLGCLPMLLQMPVWFALYSALQSAVELYHTPFGPFIPDLSAPGEYYIIPIVLGASSYLQQRLMPMQGDPAQQKMMLYMMPTIFTVMMLFLPAGLGVYILTNVWLGIVQQLAVEKWMKSRLPAADDGKLAKVSGKSSEGSVDSSSLGKGKARVRG